MGFLVVWSKKKIGDGNIFARTDFWSTLFLKMFPTSKWAKLNGFEQLTSRAFRIRSQILVAMSSFYFRAFFLKPENCGPVRVKTPAPPSRPQKRRRIFRCSAMNVDPQKKKELGIFAHRWCGHLVKISPMKFCLREPKNEKNDFDVRRIRIFKYAGGTNSQKCF